MKQFLIVKISAIGDVIMAMPMVKAIREKYPDAHITWVCGKGVYSLLKHLPIDEIITVSEKKLLAGSKLDKVGEVLSLWKKIGGKAYDVIALGHADKRYRILIARSKGKVVRTFSHELGKTCPIPGRHHTDEYVRLVLGDLPRETITPPVELHLPLSDSLKEIFPGNKKCIVLLPGGAKNLLADDFCRRWPIENYVTLAKMLITARYEVILSGAPSDDWVREYFKNLPVIDLIGKTNLEELLALFNYVDGVVTHDSGPMHLAGTTKCKIIALFGPTNPYEKVPRRKGVTLLWDAEKYNCCPCYDGKNYAKCKNNICLRNISADRVMKNLLK